MDKKANRIIITKMFSIIMMGIFTLLVTDNTKQKLNQIEALTNKLEQFIIELAQKDWL